MIGNVWEELIQHKLYREGAARGLGLTEQS